MRVDTSTLAELLGRTSRFYLDKRDKDFIKNKHYFQRGNAIVWDLEAVKLWWEGEDVEYQVNEILDRVLCS